MAILHLFEKSPVQHSGGLQVNIFQHRVGLPLPLVETSCVVESADQPLARLHRCLHNPREAVGRFRGTDSLAKILVHHRLHLMLANLLAIEAEAYLSDLSRPLEGNPTFPEELPRGVGVRDGEPQETRELAGQSFQLSAGHTAS